MAEKLFWIHDKHLTESYENLRSTGNDFKAVFIWDDPFFRKRAYSLKRLVFIYETVSQMSLDIVRGDTVEVLSSLSPDGIATFFTPDTEIQGLISKLTRTHEIEIIRPEPFVQIPEKHDFKRFFKYWDKAKKTAFLKNGKDA